MSYYSGETCAKLAHRSRKDCNEAHQPALAFWQSWAKGCPHSGDPALSITHKEVNHGAV